MVVVSLPRFGALSEPLNPRLYGYDTRGGRHLHSLTVDMREYLHLTEYYAGRAEAPDLAPFTFRSGVPWLAGQLPWDAPISLNLVVLGFLGIGLIAVVMSLVRLRCPQGAVVTAILVWSVAFPVFYWGAFNYVDGAVVGLLAVVVSALVYRRLALALAVVVIGLLVKESMLVAVPSVLTWIWIGGAGIRRRVALLVVTLVAVAGAMSVARVLGPEPERVYNPWFPSLTEVNHYVGWNMSRAGPVGQVLLTAVVPLGLCYLAWRHVRAGVREFDARIVWTMVAGVATGVMLNIHAFLAAQWDGRTIWTTYPFAIVLAAATLTGSGESSSADAGDGWSLGGVAA